MTKDKKTALRQLAEAETQSQPKKNKTKQNNKQTEKNSILGAAIHNWERSQTYRTLL